MFVFVVCICSAVCYSGYYYGHKPARVVMREGLEAGRDHAQLYNRHSLDYHAAEASALRAAHMAMDRVSTRPKSFAEAVNFKAEEEEDKE